MNGRLVSFVIGAVGFVTAIVIGGVYADFNDQRSAGEERELYLTDAYRTLSVAAESCFDGYSAPGQVTWEEWHAIKGVVVDVVTARYVHADHSPTDASGPFEGGLLVSALQDKYPQMGQSGADELQEIVVMCREKVSSKYDTVQALTTSYDEWLTDSETWMSDWAKRPFPSRRLVAVNGNMSRVYEGQMALDYIARTGSVSEIIEASLSAPMLVSENLISSK